MTGMSIQERYDDISATSGLSEEIIRRVFKATRESIVKSLKRGERATIPGIVTITPEIRKKIDREHGVVKDYIKIKSAASPALGTELSGISSFENDEDEAAKKAIEDARMNNLTFVDKYGNKSNGILTTQISALL